MTPHAKTIVQRFRALDRALQAHGWVPTSPWWHDVIARFYASGCRQLVPRVGRRGGKSSTLCRLAVCEGLYGRHVIPPGDVGVVSLVAQNKSEAKKRLRTIKDILKVLGIRYHPTPNGVELDDRAIAFECYAASIQGVSGFTSVMVLCDEVAKWRDADTGVNPATEVLASIRPTMATQPEARIILSSSPFGRFDAHYDAFERGDTDFQMVASAQSWVANPTLTEARTHDLEPDPLAWGREYACIPSDDAAEAIVTGAEIDKVTRPGPLHVPFQAGHEYVAAIDPATKTNAWTLVIATLRWCDAVSADGHAMRKLKRSVVYTQEWRGKPSVPLSPKAVLHHIAGVLGTYSIDTLWTDQGAGPEAMRDLASDMGINLIAEPATLASNVAMYKNFATWIRSDQVELPPDPKVRQDLLGVRRRITRAGEGLDLLVTPDGRHCDYAPSIARAFRRPISEPVDTAIPGTREAELQRKRERFEHFTAENDRPHWKPKGAFDRGDGAFWRR